MLLRSLLILIARPSTALGYPFRCVATGAALDPPVMTATLPSSFPMTSPFGLRLWSFGEAPENPDMGLPASGVEGGSAHIGGAKSIRLDD
jgi:hypothetical protein